MIAELRARDPLLFWTGAAMLLGLVVVTLLSISDQRLILGINPWIKPMKFLISIATFLWTLAWFMPETEPDPVRRALVRWTVAGAMLIEIVLVSLADSCEAASRSLDRPTAAKISAMVDAIFNDRLRDHGLDDADLTVSELARSRDVMIRTLATMMHARVPYPKEGGHEGDSVEAGAPAAAEGSPAAAVRPG